MRRIASLDPRVILLLAAGLTAAAASVRADSDGPVVRPVIVIDDRLDSHRPEAAEKNAVATVIEDFDCSSGSCLFTLNPDVQVTTTTNCS